MTFQLIENRETKRDADASFLGPEKARKARTYHESFPQYCATPLQKLSALAEQLGVQGIYVKDESYRFGLNAFKVLGGSYAIGRYIAERLGIPLSELTFEKLTSAKLKEQLGDITFISATDGNHGRGVAWAARQLGQKSVIYMPRGSARERFDNIRREGADVTITDLNYDDAVRKADEDARENGWVLVQDTSWPGYEDIPRWIMQGYTTLSLEIFEQLGDIRPTHIFLQAGVGSFSSSAAGFFAQAYGKDHRPAVTIVEPDAADCIFRTMKAADGQLHPVKGDMNTIMAGLACGEPVTVGIDVLRSYADFFISCPDSAAADGMRILSSPAGEDARIISGESGAAAFGACMEILMREQLQPLKEKLGIDRYSVLLFISTEGATDPVNYRNVVWNGAYPWTEHPGEAASSDFI